MKSYPHPILAREGWHPLTLALVGSLAVHYFFGPWTALPWWVATVFMIQFFRDPARVVSGDAKSVVAPADGRIVAIEKTLDPYLNRETVKVSVFMNVFNVHSNRSPVDGVVTGRWYNPGRFLNAAIDKASVENERCAIALRTPCQQEVTSVQIAGLIARRILNYAEEGQNLERGDRYGFIRFGSRVDVYLPLNAEINVALGDKVKASTTVLARLA